MGFRRAAAVLAAAAPAPVPMSPTMGAGLASPWQPDDVLRRITFEELFGVTEDDLNREVTRDRAMSLAVVARARNVLCPTVGRLPLHAYTTATPNKPDADSAYDFLRQPEGNPDAFRPGFITYLWTVDALKFFGRAWWVVTGRYAETNRPRWFRWVPEWDAKLVNGQLVGTLAGESFAAADVVRIDGPDEGVLNYARRELNMAIAMDRAAAHTANNPVPAINLQEQAGVAPAHKLGEPEIDKLTARWRAARRAGKTVSYTPASVKPEVLGLNVEQLLIEGRKFSALQLTRVMSMPAWSTDVPLEGSSITYSNVPSRSRELIDYGAMPYLNAIEARLSCDDILPRGVWCKFDLNELLRGSFGDRMIDYKAAKESEVYTTDELRDMENLPPTQAEPAPEGDNN